MRENEPAATPSALRLVGQRLPAWLPSGLGHGHARMQVLQYMGDRQSRAPLAELGRALLAAALADALVRDELFCQVGRIIYRGSPRRPSNVS
jgi:hypothetical protein